MKCFNLILLSYDIIVRFFVLCAYVILFDKYVELCEN